MLDKVKSYFKTERKLEKVGRIKTFSTRKGYGFIQSKLTTKDVFVHASELKDKVKQGDRVQFLLQFSEKGLHAENVRLANS
ncbi:MAG: cold shock domain-containing protein [Saprospiraceae bacterium]